MLAAVAVVLMVQSCTGIKQNPSESGQSGQRTQTLSETKKGCSIKFHPTNAPEIARFNEAVARTSDEDKCQALWWPVVREDLETALKRKDFQTAGYLSQEMLAICPEEAGTFSGAKHAHLLEKLGDIYKDTLHYDCAIESYEKFRDIVGEWNPYDPFFYAEDVIKKLSSLYTFTGDLWEAERWDRRLLMRAKRIGRPLDIDVLVRMAWRSLDLGLFAEAKRRFQEAETLLKESGQGKSFYMVRTVIGLAQTYDEEEDYRHAQEFYREALKILEGEQGTTSSQPNPMQQYFLGLTYIKLGRVDEGIKLLESAVISFNNVGEPAVGLIYGHLANAYRIKRDYDKPMRYIRKAKLQSLDLFQLTVGSAECIFIMLQSRGYSVKSQKH